MTSQLARVLHACLRDLARTGLPEHFETAKGAPRSYVRLAPSAIGCEAWLICWPPGASAPLHDHGPARGLAQVVQGSLHEWRSSGPTSDGTERIWQPGRPVQLPFGVRHEVQNRSTEVAYSVHLYDPRLERMTFYERTEGGELHAIRREEAREW